MKKKAPRGWVKILKFEQLTGISSKTIDTAINQGKISVKFADRVGSATTFVYYLNPKKAAVEWYNNINLNHPLSRSLHEQLAKYINTFSPAAIIDSAEGEDLTSEETKTNKKEISITEAQRRHWLAKAKLAELELEEKQGKSIQLEHAENAYCTASREVRDAILAVPDRMTDTLIAESGNRNKFHTILYNALAAELEKLADAPALISQ